MPRFTKKDIVFRIAVPHNFIADLDSDFFQFHADLQFYADLDQIFTLNWIWILLLIKVMRIGNYWSTNTPHLNVERAWLSVVPFGPL
jgi:hypothetical protein